MKDEEIEFAKLMENKYPGEYECSKHIAEYIENGEVVNSKTIEILQSLVDRFVDLIKRY